MSRQPPSGRGAIGLWTLLSASVHAERGCAHERSLIRRPGGTWNSVGAVGGASAARRAEIAPAQKKSAASGAGRERRASDFMGHSDATENSWDETPVSSAR